jgi:hypothetical protein
MSYLYAISMYLPPVSFFEALLRAENLLIEVHDHFERGTLRNHCEIAGPNGRQKLIVPIRKPFRKIPVKDIQIAYEEPWNRRHIQGIKTAYGSAPYYPFYEEKIIHVLLTHSKYLLDLNNQLLEVLLGCGNLSISVDYTDSYAGSAPMSNKLIHEAWLSYNPKHKNSIKQYRQIFSEKYGFLDNLSFLDLIMCHGPQWKNILKG